MSGGTATLTTSNLTVGSHTILAAFIGNASYSASSSSPLLQAVNTPQDSLKLRAMQIIDEVEPHRRGPYAGAVGYVDFTGNMDTCIALRTLVMQGSKAYVQAGAGIVADSDPASEQAECINKAKALFRAADEARRFASAAGRGQ